MAHSREIDRSAPNAWCQRTLAPNSFGADYRYVQVIIKLLLLLLLLLIESRRNKYLRELLFHSRC
jgi:hypothetical protein